MNSGTNRQIISAITGGAGFGIFYLLLAFSLPVSFLLSAGIYGAVILITSPRKGRINYEGVSQDYIKETVSKGMEKIGEMRLLAKKIPKEHIKNKILQMCATGEKIIGDYLKDGNDTAIIRKFSITYLDSMISILRRYTEIIERGVKGKEIDDACTKVETMIDKMQKTWEHLHSKSYSTELLNLETELSVTERNIKMENIDES